ncbi:MAG: GrpB family protein [Actinomycetota bacterium]|nr:GrpB family protein [Actinomycetota bacterium]
MPESLDFPEPLTDDEIAEATVGDPVRLDGRIELQAPDPSWAHLYAREEARIRSVLGGKALLVEHVGSTAVPKLAAKPIIDLVLAVVDSSDEESYVPAMEAAGYILTIREEEWFEHRLFKGPDTTVNLHVFSEGAAEIVRMIAFRDHLRTNPEDRTLYENVKRDLASRHWKFVQNYADAKSLVIAEIMKRALI